MSAIRRHTIPGALAAAVRIYRAELPTMLAVGVALGAPLILLDVASLAAADLAAADLAAADLLVAPRWAPLPDDPGGWLTGRSSATGWGLVVGTVRAALGMALAAVGTATITLVVRGAALGRRLDLAGAAQRIAPHLPTLLATGLLAGLAIMAGSALCLLPGVIAVLALAFVGPIVVLEGRGGVAALRRSWQLTRGRLLKVCAALLSVTVGLGLATIAVSASARPWLPASLAGDVTATALSGLTWAALEPIAHATVALLYYDARVAREAYDVEVRALHGAAAAG